MSKYIKLEDALKGLNMGYGKYDYVSKVADYYNNLPTIEVDEVNISREAVVEILQKHWTDDSQYITMWLCQKADIQRKEVEE